ncbi:MULTISPECIES: hypothetical protein [unclassified Acinetobacter]|uniref:hypothetical protein n=1 Tax=unclassified Acinetobacter TaxID=196816 RepID=UPI00157ABF4D|nr:MULTISPECIES: hypothetical protein [unclassified Acinetobacter]MDM1758906.1 hypothetical protein [Acinetobacter sp. 256-1]MDM1762218.1 hypothetical protein [Acinetobacter sp. 251-1]
MEWIEPWHLIDLDKQELFNAELEKELHPAHILFNSKLNAIAKSSANDDVLYAFTDGTIRVADVHLTWKGRTEISQYPISIIYCSLDKWKSFVLYDEVLPLVDYSNTICMLGYFLMNHLEYEDYFKWAEKLVEQNCSLDELDILLSYSLDEHIQSVEFLDFIECFFRKLGFNLKHTEQCLYEFIMYLCDRIIVDSSELDDAIRIFKKLDQIFGDGFDFIVEWARLRIDLYNIYTYEETVYFKELSLMNYQNFAIEFAQRFKEKIMISQLNRF